MASAIGYAEASRTITLDAGVQRRVSLQLTSERYGLDEVVVSATRSRQGLGSVASSVSVLGPQDLQSQSAVTGDLGDMLAQTVPGLAPSNGSLSNFGETLRGRSPFVMIDGIPQNTPLRDGARSLRTTSPEVIERIGIVRGASALYGYGATGGAINIITKEPTPDPEATTEVGLRGSSADITESFTGRLHQSMTGRANGIGFVASGSYESWGQFYDGRGNLIAQDPRGQGGLAGADEISLFGKVEGIVAESQRLLASVNYYSFRQDLEFGRQSVTYGETPTAASYRDVMAAVDGVLPEAEPTYLYFPESAEAPVTVRLRTPPEWHPNGRSFVYVQPGCLNPARGRCARGVLGRTGTPDFLSTPRWGRRRDRGEVVVCDPGPRARRLVGHGHCHLVPALADGGSDHRASLRYEAQHAACGRDTGTAFHERAHVAPLALTGLDGGRAG